MGRPLPPFFEWTPSTYGDPQGYAVICNQDAPYFLTTTPDPWIALEQIPADCLNIAVVAYRGARFSEWSEWSLPIPEPASGLTLAVCLGAILVTRAIRRTWRHR